LKKEQDDAPTNNTTEVLGELLSADGHGVHDTNVISSEFQPDRSPVRKGNKEVESRNDEEEESNNDEKVVENADEEEREKVVVSVNELIWIPCYSTRTKSIDCGQVNTIRDWEGQESSNIRNERNSHHNDSSKTVPQPVILVQGPCFSKPFGSLYFIFSCCEDFFQRASNQRCMNR